MNYFRPSTWSIRTRLVVGVTLLYAALMGIFILDLVQRQQHFLHQEQAADALGLSQAIAQAGTSAVLAGDVVGLQEVLAATAGTRELRYGFVVDDDGKVLAHTDRGLVGKYIADPVSLQVRDRGTEARLLVDSPDLIDAVAPVLEHGRAVGWVRVGLGQESRQKAIAGVIANGIVYALIAILAGALFAVWVARQLTKGLYGLLQVAEATREGERSHRAEITGGDEVATLARAFNRMLDRLADSEKELRGLNEDLEQRVEARTSDLTTANEEVRKSEALFRGLLESSADAILLVNEQGRIILANAECSRVFGYTRQELIGQPVEMLIPGRIGNHRALRESYHLAPGIRPMGVGRRVLGLQRDGAEFPAEVRLSPLQTEEGLIVSAIIRDVTERQQAEDRLRASERKFRLLLENLPHRVFSKDGNSVFLAVNPAFARVFGRTPEEIVGCTDFDLLEPERARYIQELDRKVMSTGERVEFDERIVIEGETRVFHTMKAPVRDDEENIVGLLGISWDITDRKRTEDALAEASHNAEAANQAKSDFLANMSHEIRTPMNAVIGLAHLLGQTPLDARQRDYLDKISSSANALLALLNGILDLSKVEAGKLELESRPFRLDRQMRDLATILSANAQSKDIEILFDIDPRVPGELVGDAMRLNQILINLAGNAIKFTDHGEVVVSVAPVQLSDDGVELRFSIRDTGIGITPEQRDRLFQAFNQGDSSTSRRFGGTGLGLAICRHLVQLMGGALDVASAPGKGSDFHFTARFGRPAASPEKSLPQGIPDKLRVLVVDDNATAREVMGNLVATFGWEADIVASGEEALERLQAAEKPYDAILLDWKMPGMDGLETSRRIREITRDGHPPMIIVVTAYGREFVSRKAAKQQIDAMLVKPVTASMLFDALADVFGAAPAEPVAQALVGLATRPLAGLRLLVAEDNLINQQVASEMLGQAGAMVSLANNGAEAVERFREEGASFDAVLMDLQMPEMDGFAATAMLRTLPEGDGIPIIAMTANAMASDRERCLAAGMNDHVAKPLSPEVLVSTICRWTRGEVESGYGKGLENVSCTVIPGIDMPAVLSRLGGNEAILRQLLDLFCRQLPQALDACASASGPREMEAAAHSLKGMAANLGAMDLSQAAAALECAAQAGSEAKDWPGLLETLRQRAEEVLAGLRSSGLGEPAARAPGATEVDAAALAAALAELDRLLADDNFAAADAFAALGNDLASVAGNEGVAELAAAIETFDFAAARRQLALLTRQLPA